MDVTQILALAQGLQSNQIMNKLTGTVAIGLQQDGKHRKLMNKIEACKELSIPFTPTEEQQKKIHDAITDELSDL